MEKVEEIDLREIFLILKKQAKIIVILPLVAMLTSVVLSLFVLTPIYRAETTLVVNMQVQASNDVNGLNNSFRLSRELVPTYKELIISKKVTDKVNKIIIKETDISDVEEIEAVANVESVGNTELMKISVDDKNPQLATLYANTLAQVFANEIPNIMNIDNVKIIDEAQVPEEPTKPNKKLNLAIAGVIGLLVALGMVFLGEFLDNTYKKEEDVKRELGLPVLGIIPDHK